MWCFQVSSLSMWIPRNFVWSTSLYVSLFKLISFWCMVEWWNSITLVLFLFSIRLLLLNQELESLSTSAAKLNLFFRTFSVMSVPFMHLCRHSYQSMGCPISKNEKLSLRNIKYRVYASLCLEFKQASVLSSFPQKRDNLQVLQLFPYLPICEPHNRK